MNVISNKKKKMGCLEKSKMDWDSFVTQNSLKEDLQSHNRGKDGSVMSLIKTQKSSKLTVNSYFSDISLNFQELSM